MHGGAAVCVGGGGGGGLTCSRLDTDSTACQRAHCFFKQWQLLSSLCTGSSSRLNPLLEQCPPLFPASLVAACPRGDVTALLIGKQKQKGAIHCFYKQAACLY